MSKIRWFILVVFIILVVTVCLGVVVLVRDTQEGNGINFFGLKEVISEEPIKGPDRGEWGNDLDNTFRTLTISPTNSDVVYVGSEGNGMFRTLDGGVNWDWLRNGLKHEGSHYPEIYDMAIDENNESVVLAATTNGPSPIYSDEYSVPVTAGIYRSENGGDTWTQYLEGLPNSAISSLIQFPGVLDTFVAGLDGQMSSRDNYSGLDNFGGLYISRDSGRSWEALPIPEEGVENRYSKLLVRGEKSAPILYTAGLVWEKNQGSYQAEMSNVGIGLLRGTYEGQTWTKINPGDAFVLYFDVSAEGNTIYAGDLDESLIHISHDRGESWEQVNGRGLGAIKISPEDKEKVLFAAGNGVYLTEDGFQTEQKVLTLEDGVNDIEYFKGDPNIVYVSGSGLVVYKSVDGGRTFEQVANLREMIDGISSSAW